MNRDYIRLDSLSRSNQSLRALTNVQGSLIYKADSTLNLLQRKNQNLELDNTMKTQQAEWWKEQSQSDRAELVNTLKRNERKGWMIGAAIGLVIGRLLLR